MIKLRSILNEVKLIPPNRILLKAGIDSYYFETNDTKYYVYNYQLNKEGWVYYRYLKFKEKDYLTKFLDSKKIKYIDGRDGAIYIPNEYFIIPDKINEIKNINITSKLNLNKEGELDVYLVNLILKQYIPNIKQEDIDNFIDTIDNSPEEYENITSKKLIDDFKLFQIDPDVFYEGYKNESYEKKYKINYNYYNKLLGISNQYETKYIKKVLDNIHNNQNDMATQRQYNLLKKFADGYGNNDKYSYSTKNEVKLLKGNFVYIDEQNRWMNDNRIVISPFNRYYDDYETEFYPINIISILKKYLKNQDIPFIYVGGFGQGKIEKIPSKYIKKY